MKIDILIKRAVEGEIKYNQSRMPPVKHIGDLQKHDFKKGERQKTPLVWSHAILAASFMILLFIAIILMKDRILSSPPADKTAGIETLFPENPAHAVYDFLFEPNASL